jgi:hypothetical protein
MVKPLTRVESCARTAQSIDTSALLYFTTMAHKDVLCCCEMSAQKCLKESQNGGMYSFIYFMERDTFVALVAALGTAASTLGAHYLWSRMNPPPTRFLYEYPSEVILGLQKEYKMDTEV